MIKSKTIYNKTCCSTGVSTPNAILNSRSAAILAAGGGLTQTAALVTWHLRVVVHSAPLSTAITGRCTQRKTFLFVSRKKKESWFIMKYNLAFRNKGYFLNKHNNRSDDVLPAPLFTR